MGLVDTVVCFCFCFVVVSVQIVAGLDNNRPIVGVLTAPYDEADPTKGSFFRSSYVQWLEQSGARVSPIFYDAPQSELKRMWSGLNGILFTGGELSLLPDTTYFQAAQYLYNLTIEASLKGDYLPIWGTCMGMQLLSILSAESQDVLSRYAFDSENLPLPLKFTFDAYTSFLFGSAPLDVINIFATEDVTMNLHHDGVTPEAYAKSQKMQNVFAVLSTNRDRLGKIFLSTIEGKNAYLYGVQWHPERNQFNWDTTELNPHSTNAVKVAAYTAERFMVAVRQNSHKFASQQEESASLVYHWTPIYDGEQTKTYTFPKFVSKKS